MRAALLGLLLVLLGACRREERRFREPLGSKPGNHAALVRYSEDAWAIGEGQRLFSQMNCAGCHSHGGGGAMGPALMDGKWRYGSDVDAIQSSIVEGRPNGMPSFRTRLSAQQVWQLVAYVRSLSGNAPPQAAPARDDHMSVRPPPSRTTPVPPSQESVD